MDRVHIPPISALEPRAGTRAVGRSDVGRSRNENQDYMGVFRVEDRLLAVVADGMGGHSGGYEASRIAVDAMREAFVQAPSESPGKVLVAGISGAHRKIRLVAEASPELAGMGTTLVAALVSEGKVWICHVGDSRAYLLRAGQLTQLTLDHSRVNRLLVEGMIKPEQVADHPMGHILERTVGATDTVEPEMRPAPIALQRGDRVILCSDGVWSVVGDAELLHCGDAADLSLAAEEALGLALVRNTDDNATIVVLEAADGPRSAPAVPDVRVAFRPGGGGSGRRLWLLAAVVAAFLLGAALGAWVRQPSADEAKVEEPAADAPAPTVEVEEAKTGKAGPPTDDKAGRELRELLEQLQQMAADIGKGTADGPDQKDLQDWIKKGLKILEKLEKKRPGADEPSGQPAGSTPSPAEPSKTANP